MLNYRQFLFVFLAFFITVFASYVYTSRMVGEELLINGEGLIQVAEARIRAELAQAEVFLTDTCLYVEDMLPKRSGEADIQSLLQWITAQTYGKQDRIIHGLVGVYGYIQGAYVGGLDGWLPPDNLDPHTRPWYVGALAEQRNLHYTGPYIDGSTGQPVVSLSKKVTAPSGKSVGVIAIDVDLSEMAPLVADLGRASVGYYGLVLDENFDIITHGQDQRLIGRNFAAVNEDCAAVAAALKASPDGRITGMRFTNHQGAKSIVFFGKIFNGWYTGVITSISRFYAGVYQMGLVIAALGALMMLTLSASLVSVYGAKLRSEEKNRSKTNFLAKMSHEIRTPMNAIVGMSELILREDVPPDIYEYALGIKQSSANLLSIINDILDFSKIESGKMEILEAPYLLASVINDVVTIIRMRLGEKPVCLLAAIDPKIPNKLIGDEVRIRQIILNILNNAVKYTETGVITFSIEGETGSPEAEKQILLNIRITDTGIGIKPEDADKVFGDFVQFNMAAHKGIEGTGLGLAITKSLCNAMDGEISFTSEYGRGTAFTVLLPQGISDPLPLASVPEPETKGVLVYEMNDPCARSIQWNLDALGVPHHWVTVQSDFYELLKQNSYSFIFISSLLYEGAKNIAQRLGLQSKLVIMINCGEEIGLRDVITLALPAHALSIADILNNSAESRRYKREPPTRFIAPTARILIVDDISTNLKVAEGLMAPFKMRIDTCKSGPEALGLVKKNKYDIVFMDHMMPGMDGIEAAGHIRDLGGEAYKKLPIIALTANAVSGVREMFLQNNMNDFLSKPIDIARLIGILQKWIPLKKQEKYYPPAKEPPLRRRDTVGAESLPAIIGVDTAKGLAMTGGTPEAYLSTLRIFLEDGKEKIPQIRSCFETGNIGLYTTVVHAVKSAAASIGAGDLSEYAKTLETAGKNEDTEYIAHHTPHFLETFSHILENIDTAVTPRQSKHTAGELKTALQELKTALTAMDMGKAERIITTVETEKRETIEKHILLSDYDKAVAVIDRYLQETE